MQKIPLNNLKIQYAELETEIFAVMRRVLESGWYILGNELEKFEEEFALYNGVKHCVGVANGTDALELALRAVGVTALDQVITVANAGMYSTTAILAIGAKPVFADIDINSMTICPNSVKKLISSSTKAIVVTHLYGQLAAIDTLRLLSANTGVALIEDCAQSHGASLGAKKAGSWGDCAAFSFYPTKNLGALGDGGAVITSNPEISERIRSLRQYGWANKYMVSLEGGRNSRLDEIQAAILRVKLNYLDEMNRQRKNLVQIYSENIFHSHIQKPISLGDDYVAHLYVIRTESRDKLMEHLTSKGIGCEVHYPILDYQQVIIRNKHIGTVLPNSEKVVREILTLPCYPGISEEDILRVCTCVNEWEQ